MQSRMQQLPRHHWSGVVTAWGEALTAAVPPSGLPALFRGELLALAIRADVAGETASASEQYGHWFRAVIASGVMPDPALLRLARWRMQSVMPLQAPR